MEVNKLYKLISQTEHYSAVPVYCTSIKILVAKKKTTPTKTLATQGLLKMELCKLPSSVISAARMY